jgi:hypothetical protein
LASRHHRAGKRDTAIGSSIRRDGGQHADIINLQSDIVRPTRSSKTRGAKYAGITTFLKGEKQSLSTVAQTTAKPLTNLSIHIHMPELAVNLQRVFYYFSFFINLR